MEDELRMGKQKEKFKNFSDKIKYLRTLEKDLLIGLLLGATQISTKDLHTMIRYMRKELRGK